MRIFAAFLAILTAGTLRASNEVLWRDPGPVERLDLGNGPGGARTRPRPPYRFLKEDLSGTRPKVTVVDANGRKWVVKFGHENHAEAFAGRLVWACGYFVEPVHFIRSGRIEGVHNLKRARKAIGEEGRFENARFQIRDPGYEYSNSYNWSWKNNPFIGTRQLNGLKILMMLTSNWDNKDATFQDQGINTGIFVGRRAQRERYIYSFVDWGGTMGHWGVWPSYSVWNCPAYARQSHSFVKGVEEGEVEFGYSGKDANDLRKGIRPTDVNWLMRFLGRIEDRQLRAALLASGATPSETACFTAAVRERIDQLARVAKAE